MNFSSSCTTTITTILKNKIKFLEVSHLKYSNSKQKIVQKEQKQKPCGVGEVMLIPYTTAKYTQVMQKYIGIKQKRHAQTEFCQKQDNQKDNKTRKKATDNTDTGIKIHSK
jgi:hypothetical protein